MSFRFRAVLTVMTALTLTMLIPGCQPTSPRTDALGVTIAQARETETAEEASGFAVDAAILLTFNAELDASGISQRNIYVQSAAGEAVAATLHRRSAQQIEIEPQLYFQPHTDYTLFITQALQSTDHRTLAEPFVWHFTTADAIDTEAPRLSAWLPQTTENVDGYTTLGVQFTEAIMQDFAPELIVEDAEGEAVAGTPLNRRSFLRFIPEAPLDPGSYTMRLEGTVIDRASNAYAGERSWTFDVGETLPYNRGSRQLPASASLQCTLNALEAIDGTLYVAADHRLFALEATDEALTVTQAFEIDAELFGVAAADGLLYLAADTGVLVFDPQSGTTLQQLSLEAPVYGIAAYEGRVYAAATDAGTVIAAIGEEGRLSRTATLATPTAFDVRIVEGMLYVAAYHHGVWQSAPDGSDLQQIAQSGATRRLLYDDRALYGVDSLGGLHLVRTFTGTTMTQLPVLAYAMAATAYEQTIYVADKERGVAVYDLAGQARIAQIKTHDAQLGTSSERYDIFDLVCMGEMLIAATRNCTLQAFALDIDLSGPQVLQTDPVDGATEVDPATAVQIVFSEELNDSTLTGITLEEQNGVAVATSQQYDAATDTLTLMPQSTLRTGLWHTVTVPGSLTDLRGNTPPFEQYAFSFKTRYAAAQLPQVTSTEPADGNDAVEPAPFTDPIYVYFNQAVTAQSVEAAGNLQLFADQQSLEVGVTYETAMQRALLTHDPLERLEEGGYRLRVSGVENGDGAVMAEAFEAQFNISVVDSLPPEVVATFPEDGDNAVSAPLSADVTVDFDEPVIVSAGNFTLEAVDGQAVAITVSHVEGASRVSLGHAPLYDALLGYKLTVQGVEDAAGNVMGTPYTAYFNVAVTDRTAPQVIAFMPEAPVEAPYTEGFRLTFDEPVDTDTVTAETIVLEDAEGAPVALSGFAFDQNGTEVTVSTATLAAGVYTVVIEAIADAAGNALERQTFTLTVEAGESVGTLDVSDVYPTRDSSQDEPFSEDAWLYFDETMDPQSITTATVYLTDATGAMVDELTVTPAGQKVWIGFAPLPPGSYTIHADGVQSASGNTLPEPFSSEFLVVDATPPVVESSWPEPDALFETVFEGPVLIIFNESVDPASLAEATVRLVDADDVAVEGQSLQHESGSLEVRITVPDLPEGVYAVRVSGVRDVSGNTMAEEYVARFAVAPVEVETGYSIGGEVFGLEGQLILQNMGEKLTIEADGPFTFTRRYAEGSLYDVNIDEAPAGQVCSVVNGFRLLGSSNVTDVYVYCNTRSSSSKAVTSSSVAASVSSAASSSAVSISSAASSSAASSSAALSSSSAVSSSVSSIVYEDLIVTTTDDEPDANPGDGICDWGPGECSLRAAIMEANARPGADTITVPEGHYVIENVEDDVEDSEAINDFDITEDLIINGAGASQTLVDGNGRVGVFEIHGAIPVTLYGMKIKHGNGGGIRSEKGTLRVEKSIVYDNIAASGGGIYAGSGSDLTLLETEVSYNTTYYYETNTDGAGLYCDGARVWIERSAFIANEVADGPSHGGGVYCENGDLTVINTTFSGNVAHTLGGGGLYLAGGTARLYNVTVSESVGYGIYVASNTDVGVYNTIIAEQSQDADCGGAAFSATSHNIDSDNSCGTLLFSPYEPGALIEGLGYNDGLTPTHALPPNSPAIDNGDQDICAGEEVGRVDQRDYDRDDGYCDVGAYERQEPKVDMIDPEPYESVTGPFAGPIRATFDREVSLDGAWVELYRDYYGEYEDPIEGVSVVEGNGMEALIGLDGPLGAGSYILRLGGAVDAAGNAMSDYESYFYVTVSPASSSAAATSSSSIAATSSSAASLASSEAAVISSSSSDANVSSSSLSSVSSAASLASSEAAVISSSSSDANVSSSSLSSTASSASSVSSEPTDVTPPSVETYSPANGAVLAAPFSGSVELTLSEALDPATVNATTLWLEDANGGAVKITRTLLDGDTRLVLYRDDVDGNAKHASVPLPAGTYTLYVDGIADLSGNVMALFSFTFEVVDPPEVIKVEPAAGEILEDFSGPFYIYFSKPLDAATVTLQSVYLNTVADGPLTPSFFYYNSLVNTMTLDFDHLSAGTYTLYVTDAVTDTQGIALAATYTAVFYVADSDTTPPTVVDVDPAESEKVASPFGGPIYVTFSEAIDESTLLSGIDVVNSDFVSVGIDAVSYDATQFRATIAIPSLGNGSYYVKVFDSITDLSGNALQAEVISPFEVTDLTPPDVINTAPQGDVDPPFDGVIQVMFDETLNPATVTSSSVYVTQCYTDTSTGDEMCPYDASNPLPATVTYDSQANTVTLIPDYSLYPYSYDPGTADTLSIYVDGVSDWYDNTLSAALPVGTFLLNSGDTTAPTVVSTNPSVAVNAPYSGDINVTFDEPIDVATMTASTVIVEGCDTIVDPEVCTQLGGTLSYDAGSQTITFQPDSPINISEVRIYIRGVADTSGNALNDTDPVGTFTLIFF